MGTIHVLPERVMGKVWRKSEIKKTMQGMNPQALTRLVQFVQSQPDLRMHCAEPLRDMNTSRVLTPKQISAVILHWMPAWVAATAFNRKIGNAAGLRVEVPDVITSWNQVHYVAFLDGVDTPFRVEPSGSSDGSRWVDVYPTALPGADPREFLPRGTDISLNVDNGLQNVSKLLMKTAGYRLPMLAGHDLNLGQVKENPRPQSGKAASVPVTRELIEQIKYGPLITAGPRKGQRAGGMGAPFRAEDPSTTHFPVEKCSSCMAVQTPGWKTCWRCNLARFDAKGVDTALVGFEQIGLIHEHAKSILQKHGLPGEISRKSIEKLKKKLLDEQRSLRAQVLESEEFNAPIEYTESPASKTDKALVALSVGQRITLAKKYAGPSNCLGTIVGANPREPYIALWYRNHAWGFIPSDVSHVSEVKGYDNAYPRVSEEATRNAIAIARKFVDAANEVAANAEDHETASSSRQAASQRIGEIEYEIQELRKEELYLDWIRSGANFALAADPRFTTEANVEYRFYDDTIDAQGVREESGLYISIFSPDRMEHSGQKEIGDGGVRPIDLTVPTYLTALWKYLEIVKPESISRVVPLSNAAHGGLLQLHLDMQLADISLAKNVKIYAAADQYYSYLPDLKKAVTRFLKDPLVISMKNPARDSFLGFSTHDIDRDDYLHYNTPLNEARGHQAKTGCSFNVLRSLTGLLGDPTSNKIFAAAYAKVGLENTIDKARYASYPRYNEILLRCVCENIEGLNEAQILRKFVETVLDKNYGVRSQKGLSRIPKDVAEELVKSLLPILVRLNRAAQPSLSLFAQMVKVGTENQDLVTNDWVMQEIQWYAPLEWLAENLIDAIEYWRLPPIKQTKVQSFEFLTEHQSSSRLVDLFNTRLNVKPGYFSAAPVRPMRGVENPRRKIPIVRKAPR